jgi:hypothetical protein
VIDPGGDIMFKTIRLGPHILVQGLFVRQLKNGKIVVRVGNQTFTGSPVNAGAA